MKNAVKYIIVSLKNHTIHHKESAKDVAAFMLGRKLTDWAVYQLQNGLPADAGELEKRLLASENPQS